jgi:hypothetical protein
VALAGDPMSRYTDWQGPLFGLSGYGKAGKDTVGAFARGAGFSRMAFGDRLKEFLYRQNPAIGINLKTEKVVRLQEMVRKEGWENAKWHPEVQMLLQHTGTEAGREVVHPDIWIIAVATEMTANQPKAVVVTDVRFPNEANWVKEMGGEMWRVNRPGNEPKKYPDGTVHVSETALDEWAGFDVTITNGGDMATLKSHVDHLITERWPHLS